MLNFTKSLAAHGSSSFDLEFKHELAQVPMDALPLHNAMAHSSQTAEGSIEPVVLKVSEQPESLQVRAGIFFSGVVAGSCCADDPSSLCEQTEYCVILVTIDKASSVANIILLDE